MKEFMLLIRNEINHQSGWTADHHTEFLRQCEAYIGELKSVGALIAAQPMIREGVIVSQSKQGWHVVPFNETLEVQVGFYHVRAKDLEEAIALAKRNPEFTFSTSARVEVRPIKTKEESTRFEYPGHVAR